MANLQGISGGLQGFNRTLQGFNVTTITPPVVSFQSLTVTDGKVYVFDRISKKIMVFTTTGTYITEFGTYGSSAGQINDIIAMDTDDSYLYLSDDGVSLNSNYLQKYDLDGNYVTRTLPPAYTYFGYVHCDGGEVFTTSSDFLVSRHEAYSSSLGFNRFASGSYGPMFAGNGQWIGLKNSRLAYCNSSISGNIAFTQWTNVSGLDGTFRLSNPPFDNVGSDFYFNSQRVGTVNSGFVRVSFPSGAATVISSTSLQMGRGIGKIYLDEVYGVFQKYVRVFDISNGTLLRQWTR